MADGLARLAPAHEHAHAIEEPERERPYRARCFGALEIPIRDVELALRADRTADLRQLLVAGRERRAGPDQQGRGIELVSQIRRQYGADLRENVARRLGELLVTAI